MKALSLFSGIGGLDLAAEAAGIEIAAMCEIEPFCRAILAKRWPGVPVIEDVRMIRGEDYAGTIDVVFGGFPCQDLSVAGRQAGLSGERSGLWFEMLRVITSCRPRFVVAENVRGAVNLALDTVRVGMEEGGYRVWPFVVPASAFGAPHKRERLFVVGVREDVADACKERLSRPGFEEDEAASEPVDEQPARCGQGGLRPRITERSGQLNPDWVEQLMGFPEGWTNPDVDEPRPWRGWPAPMGARLWMTPQAGACGMTSKTTGRPLEKSTHLQAQVYCAEADMHELVSDQYPYEFPRTVKGGKHRAARIKALGNAVVPQQAYPFFRAIAEMDALIKEAKTL